MPSKKAPKKSKQENLTQFYNVDFKFNPERTEYFKNMIDSFKRNRHGELVPKKNSKLVASAETIKNATGSELIDYDKLISIYGEDNVAQFRPTYDSITLARLHDNIRRDGATFRSLLFFVNFILGSDIELSMKLPRAFANQSRADKQLKILQQNETFLNLLDDLAEQDRIVDQKTNLEDLLFNGLGVGRSVIIKKTDQYGLTTDLLPLSSFSLGDVYVDVRNHKLLAVQYKDFETDHQLILAKDMVYFIPIPYHTTPWKKWFGHSILEPLMSITGSNRITYEIGIPEVSKRGYAPTQLIQTNFKSDAKMAEFQRSIDPLKTIVFNGPMPIKHEIINPQVDVMQLVDKGKEIDKKVYRDTTVPLVVGFQDEQNRATAHYSLNQWTVSVLVFIRSRLNNTLGPQYYSPNLQALMKKQKIRKTETEMLYQSGNNTLYLNKIQENRENILKSTIPEPFIVELHVKNISFDPFIEMSSAVISMVKAGGINWEIGLEMMGLEKYNERMKIWNEQNMFKQNEILSLEQEQNKIEFYGEKPELEKEGEIGFNTPEEKTKNTQIPFLKRTAQE